MRWLYHILERSKMPPEDSYAPASLAREGFVHASYRDAVLGSIAVHFRGVAEHDLAVLQIDPRLVGAQVIEARTPRGPMPHIHGPIPRAAVVRVIDVEAIADAPDLLDDA